jgi:hypothetical protein
MTDHHFTNVPDGQDPAAPEVRGPETAEWRDLDGSEVSRRGTDAVGDAETAEIRQLNASPERGLDASVAVARCPNCGASVDDRFCAICGQRQRALDLSLGDVLRQFVEEISSVDGRLPRTLRLLLLQPGVLTAQYLAGRRASFTPPLRLYLGASFVFFFIFMLTRSIDRAYYGLAAHGGTSGYENAMARLLILMLPLLALFLKLIYLGSRRPLLHHLVFSLHFGAAALLWTGVLTLMAAGLKASWGHHSTSPAWLPDIPYLLYAPGFAVVMIYLLIAMRRTYERGWAYSTAAAVALILGVGFVFHQAAPQLLMLLGAS